ncbi:MAG TPA: transcriptional repressor [Acidimicrobiales bacterium]|nr:transcriptional repressor [Acidimicrobiales bacterium]
MAASSRQRETEAVEVLVARLRSLGYRMTASRRAVLSALVSGTHRNAEELAAQVQKQAPDVHISTVYRNLEELERIGLVVHSHLGHGPATYQLTTDAHGHLVCERCGGSYEADSRMFAGLAKQARARFGFEIRPFHFSVLGVCEGCREE